MKVIAGRPGARMLAAVMVFLFLLPTVSYALNPQPEPPLPDISVLINGSPLTMDVLPIIKDGRTLVPLRAIFEALGAVVDWNDADRSVTAKKGDTTVWLQIGNAQAKVTYDLPKWSPDFSTSTGTMSSTMSITLDVPPQIVDSRSLVPARFVSEALGAKVSWEGITRTVGVDMAAPSGTNVSGVYYALWAHRKPESKSLPKAQRYGSVLVLVNRDVYPLIKPSIETYTTDLADEGYSTDVYTVNGGDAVQLKQFIRKWYDELLDAHAAGEIYQGAVRDGSGVVMIGDLPIPWIHTRMGEDTTNDNKPWDGVWTCDLYYTDMDGNWDALDDKGYPFLSTADPDVIAADSECLPSDMNASFYQTTLPKQGQGGARPELWLGHITPGPLGQGLSQQALYINTYFERNHAYRHQQFPYVAPGVDPATVWAKNRLFYWDDDWVAKAGIYVTSLQDSFPGPLKEDWEKSSTADYTRYVKSSEFTTRDDYDDLLQYTGYIWVETLNHSAPTYSEFRHDEYNWTTGKWEAVIEDYLEWNSVLMNNYRGLFYHVQGCSACRYSQANNIGTAYLFADDGLAVIGNTTVGPHDQATLHEMLSLGMNIGQALMMSQRLHLKPGWVGSEPFRADIAQPKRYYQQVLLGDPTLRPAVFTPKQAPVSAAKQPDMEVFQQNLPVGAQGPADLQALAGVVTTRLSAESPLALRKITAPIAPGSKLLPDDPSKLVVDPYPGFRLPPVIPQRTYALTLAPASQSITAGTTVVFTGTLTSTTGTAVPAPVSGKAINLYTLVTSPASGQVSRSLVGTGVTGTDGTYTIRHTPGSSGTFVAVFHGADGSDVAVSNNSVISVVIR